MSSDYEAVDQRIRSILESFRLKTEWKANRANLGWKTLYVAGEHPDIVLIR